MAAAKRANMKSTARKPATRRKLQVKEPETVVAAVERDLTDVAKGAPELARSALAATARVLAAELDSPSNSATSKSMCAARLVETMDRLRELVPPKEDDDRLDEIAARREARHRRIASA